MTTILCYGDSNTWGYVPAEGSRYDRHTRWPGVLRDTLGPDYWVVEEGLSGRTTVHNDPIEGAYKNGLTHLMPCLESHVPLELVILMLGTNDLKMRFSLSAYDIAEGAGTLVHTIQQGVWGIQPKVLMVCPPPLATLTDFAEMFTGGTVKSQRLAGHYERVAGELGCRFFDAGTVVKTSDRDGVHWEAEDHAAFAHALVPIVKAMVG